MTTTESISLNEALLPLIKRVLSKDISLDEKLFSICEHLQDNVPGFDWVGFYIVDPEVENQLKLGPYVGESTDHTTIPFGKGICGQVAVSHKTFVSQDVTEEDNYISCSIHVQSEIVVPIMKKDRFVAQIDIDSNTKNSISEEKKELLEKICTLLSNEF
ncbi:MAG TPA: gaf sensor protein [Balneola sp.]|jgi:GAF domain-containing protein|nr:gaf sensor protein [Bacteroidota bacterium]MAC05927.1 gaf sensor protein [Balneola sp.]MAO77452.1 gaf sensor protein [Balneola sp.]MBF65410.1 gaf sensor protein [Balneola sp.]HBZ38244.1 gaf sensor protein [Balneola sp.]|tara:strand:+ start:155 stop:631 length:477 start_codon:yes stop_codon:yes gene_type:complete